MPNDGDPQATSNPATDVGRLPSPWPPSANAVTDPTPVTWALVDGIGVYTASAGSPFLTAPLPADGVSGNSGTMLNESSDAFGYELRQLADPLRRQVQSVSMRFRLSEEETSGLVAAVLDLIARHLRMGRDRASHSDSKEGTS
jgi:hypothetical protein